MEQNHTHFYPRMVQDCTEKVFSGGDRPFFLRHEAGSFERVLLDAKSFEFKSQLENKAISRKKGEQRNRSIKGEC